MDGCNLSIMHKWASRTGIQVASRTRIQNVDIQFDVISGVLPIAPPALYLFIVVDDTDFSLASGFNEKSKEGVCESMLECSTTSLSSVSDQAT